MTREEAIRLIAEWAEQCRYEAIRKAAGLSISALRAQQEHVKLDRICRAALEKWGDWPQVAMVFEEMAELQKELCKNLRGSDNIDHISEEIADVQIMLEQMMILHDCRELVETWKSKKLDRLERRINDGKAD